MKFRIISIITVVFAVGFTIATFGPHQPMVLRLKVAHGPYEVLSGALNQFKQDVEKGTNGRVQVQILIPAKKEDTTLQAVDVALHEVEAGAYEMTQVYTTLLARHVKEFNVLDIPFVFRDFQHSFEVVDGPIGNELFAKLENQSALKGLAFTYSGGHRFIATADKEIHNMEDMEGLRLGSAQPTVLKLWYSELGAQIEHFGKFEAMQAIGRGEVDGFTTVYPRYLNSEVEHQAAPIVNQLHDSIQFTAIVINKQVFNALSVSDRATVERAATAASHVERQAAIDMETKTVSKADLLGLKIIALTPEERNRFEAKARQINWNKVGVSDELIDRVRRQGSELAKTGN